MECARLAAVDDEIEAMPMRYDTLVGDMGSTLSGGQKQRVLLARALYPNPAVLFIDEGTAHLDPVSERKVIDAINALPITRIVSAHRPLPVESASKIFLVNRSVAPVRPGRQVRPVDLVGS
jgi:ATP-binding cassette subfamily B protein RaxB